MNILGIHDGHNATACLIKNGEIAWVIQEERISREKNFDGFPVKAVEKIMELENISASNIDAVVLNGHHQPRPMNRLERINSYKNLSNKSNILKSNLKRIPLIDKFYINHNNKKRIGNCLKLGFNENQVNFVEHHKAHAAAAYYSFGNFNDEVLVLTNDGAGDRVCATISIGSQGKLRRLKQIHEDHSIGLLYAMFTFLTGMVPLEHEYKIMGMAPYADMKGARKVADAFHDMFDLSNDGLTWKFNKGPSIYQSLNFFKEFMYLKRFDHLMAGLQIFVEEFLTNWAKAAVRHTGVSKLALSGGTFMNVKANKAIMELDEVDEIFIFPSCGDESNSIGACFDYLSKASNEEKIAPLDDVYWGIQWNNDEVKTAYGDYDFKYSYDINYFDNIEEETARLLAEGKVVARFKGREEFGARSLGNRAILANPASHEVIKTINEMIKNRDFWMPFASSILDADINKYVKFNNKNMPYYMIMTYDTQEMASEIIGGIHPYDKTVRPQLVSQKQNKSYWQLINKFKNITGCGALLNTSLNLHGLPLVYSPEDAFEVIDNSGLEYLAIENHLISKK